MIVRVWGEINGIGATPMFNFGDEYYFSPPQTLTGRYVCQFWAEDEFGSVTNETAILYIEAGVIKNIELVSKVWKVTMLRNPWITDVHSEGYAVIPKLLDRLVVNADAWSVLNVTGKCKDVVKYDYKPIAWNELAGAVWTSLNGRTWNQMRKRVKVEG